MEHTTLLAGSQLTPSMQLTPEDARSVRFDRAVLGGYSTSQVDRFLTKTASTLESLYGALDERAVTQDELVQEIERLQQKGGHAEPDPEPAERQAVAILRAAQEQSDRMLAGARQEADRIVGVAKRHHDQVLEHVRLQADAIISESRQQADTEYRRIVGEAPAEARRQVDYFTRLALQVRDGLRGNLEHIVGQLADWDKLARDGATAPAPEPAG